MSDARPLLLSGGRIVDPSLNLDEIGDVLVRRGLIEAIGGEIDPPDDAELIDCTDCIVSPGFIDVHCHLREPGREDVETIASGARSSSGRRVYRRVRDAEHRPGHRQPGGRWIHHPSGKSRWSIESSSHRRDFCGPTRRVPRGIRRDGRRRRDRGER